MIPDPVGEAPDRLGGAEDARPELDRRVHVGQRHGPGAVAAGQGRERIALAEDLGDRGGREAVCSWSLDGP